MPAAVGLEIPVPPRDTPRVPVHVGVNVCVSLVDVIVKGGIVAAFPALVYNVYRLFSPLLTKQKRRLVILFIVMGFFW